MPVQNGVADLGDITSKKLVELFFGHVLRVEVFGIVPLQKSPVDQPRRGLVTPSADRVPAAVILNVNASRQEPDRGGNCAAPIGRRQSFTQDVPFRQLLSAFVFKSQPVFKEFSKRRIASRREVLIGQVVERGDRRMDRP